MAVQLDNVSEGLAGSVPEKSDGRRTCRDFAITFTVLLQLWLQSENIRDEDCCGPQPTRFAFACEQFGAKEATS